MKLDRRALAYACAALWGSGVLLVASLNLSFPGYGRELLTLLASVYPGYHADRNLAGVLILTGYALVDGAVGGWLLAWLYNRLVK